MATSTVAPDQTPWQKWNTELEQARRIRGYKEWVTRGEKIVKRYRDQRTDQVEYTDSEHNADAARFNILWSNVQTLLPAILAKRPKPVVERRYLDRDDAGRTASIILERALLYEIDNGTYFEALRRAVLDRLLPGRGTVWVRYEPTFRNVPAKTQETELESRRADDQEGDTDDDDSDGGDSGGLDDAAGPGGNRLSAGQGDNLGAQGVEQEQPEQEKIYECVPVDYLDWKDFLCSPARTWEEVWWVAKRVYMTRDELEDRFGDTGKTVKLDWTPATSKQGQPGINLPGVDSASKARVWEIWNKRDRKVLWTTEAENTGDGELLDEVDDPLKLESFWPVPKPLCSTLTNDTMVPVPDYIEYQDQAYELDDLTGRITQLTKAIKVAGTYDGSWPSLQRIFQEGKENELIAVDNWAEFMQKAGADGMGHIWLVPIKDMAAVLVQLYQAREQVKQSLYEITGISDIVRGQAGEGGAKTATEQRIKGQFASLRLNDTQAEVARFASDTLKIMGEIVAEHYSDETLFLVSAYEQYAKEQFLPDAQQAPSPPQPSPPPGMMGHNGGPPGPMPGDPAAMPPMQAAPPPPSLGGVGAGGGVPSPASSPAPLPPGAGPAGPGSAGLLGGLMPMGMPPQPTPEQIAAQKAADLFKRAVALLRNDKLRGFRIDVEADSMIEPDQQAVQQGRVEFLTAVGAFLEKAVPLGQMNPKFMPILGKMLLFMARSFKAGRELEGAIEQAVDDLDKQAKNPPPKQPSPEEIKAQAAVQAQQAKTQGEVAKQQMESQRAEADAQRDQQKGQQDMALAQQKAQLEIDKGKMELEIERQRMELERQKMAMEMQHHQAKLQVDQQGLAMKADAQERTAQVEAESMAHAATLEREAVDHKHEVGLEMMDSKAEAAAKAAKAKGNGAKA